MDAYSIALMTLATSSASAVLAMVVLVFIAVERRDQVSYRRGGYAAMGQMSTVHAQCAQLWTDLRGLKERLANVETLLAQREG